MARSSARAAAVQMVYENMRGGDGGEDTLRGLIEFEPEGDDQEYIDRIVGGVAQKKDELDHLISGYLKDWTIDRIARVDLSILRVSLYELLYETETHENIVCSEAVALAQRFSDENSGRFVNGVLGAFVRGRKTEETK